MLIKRLIILGTAVFFISILSLFGLYKYTKSKLPKLVTISDYQPLLVTKVFDRGGKKIGEFFRERRVLISYKDIPKDVINAFLAAEDDTFFQHKGINYVAIMRATLANLQAGHTVQGGSTITQQVAKTIILQDSGKTLGRKFRELLLAQDMEEHLSKEDILYLYLNQIYFGQGAHGIVTAAETYFRKPVNKLTLPEIAILAGLPKAPSAYSPVRNPTRAKERQVYVLNRMADVGFITKEQAKASALEPVKVFARERFEDYAPFFLETVRQLLVAKLGEEQVLDRGLRVHTSLDLAAQLAAQDSAKNGLKEVDKRQGYRGPLKNFTDPKEVGEFLLSTRNDLIEKKNPERIIEADGKFKDYGPLNVAYDVKKNGLPDYLPVGAEAEAIVSKVDDELGLVYVRIAELEGIIDLETMQWARKPDPEKRYDLDTIKKPSLALKMGDVILARVVDKSFFSQRLQKYFADKKKAAKKPDPKLEMPDLSKYITLELEQEPILEASLISFNQQTEEVLAMVGGYNFKRSEYNRALQAARQTGSAFKAIVYAAAMDKGYTPSTPIMDAPIVYEETKEDDEGQEDSKVWRPSNHSKSFSGDIIFRNSLVQSLNVPTVKIIEDIGVPYVADYSKRLGIFSPLNLDFTLALGSSSVTLFEMTKVFAQFGRLGKRIKPWIIQKVEDYTGKKILEKVYIEDRYEKELKPIEEEFEKRRTEYLEALKNKAPDSPEPIKENKNSIDAFTFFEDPNRVMKSTTAYLTTSLLKAVVEDKHGTGGRARALGREVAGKTGTTNGYYDAWFIGYTQQIATGVWVGFDHEKSIGKGEVGGRAALPIWVDYMKAAHEELPQQTFPVPDGIVFANIDADTGELASAASKNIIRQAFVEGTEPSSRRNKKEEETDFYKQDLSE